MAATDQQVQTVEIPEPSDKHEVAADEKPCFTKKHLYIAIGVVFVVAISLIGSLLDFSPSDDGVTEDSIREGTIETFPQFDVNGDGYVDQNEFTNWAANRIAERKWWCTPNDPEPTETLPNSDGTNGTVPVPREVETEFNPMDLNRDGRVSLQEAILWGIMNWRRIVALIRNGRQSTGAELMGLPAPSAAAPAVQDATCPVPNIPGFPGRVRGGYVGACQPGLQIWCHSSCFCRHKRKCHRSVIQIDWTVTDTCCGDERAANCTSCSCGGSYRFVPRGRHQRARAMCHWLSTYQCGDTDTGAPVW
jgi:hypothetical protein